MAYPSDSYPSRGSSHASRSQERSVGSGGEQGTASLSPSQQREDCSQIDELLIRTGVRGNAHRAEDSSAEHSARVVYLDEQDAFDKPAIAQGRARASADPRKGPQTAAATAPREGSPPARAAEQEAQRQMADLAQRPNRRAHSHGDTAQNWDFEREENPPEGSSRSGRFNLAEQLSQVLSGNILTRAEVRRHYPYIFFMALLMLLYIANGYYIQKLHRQQNRLSQQIQELRAHSLTISSIRMTETRQSQIIKQLETRRIPLQESLIPPKVIE